MARSKIESLVNLAQSIEVVSTSALLLFLLCLCLLVHKLFSVSDDNFKYLKLILFRITVPPPL
jgi:hypothetical protein